ncbi:ATP-binding protein [uncultured Propionivibrio sp.]|uniref:ATP-binding protein n=1 Tax=uncultured Propionivibrio sp. TaxID=426737 RepID=UPI0029BFFF5E|nr:ATP-binding protein [uncultured Propionivibrio sp.]
MNPEAPPIQDSRVDARVLFVEDDAIQLMALRRLGEKIVSAVRGAPDGLKALEIWREWQPDVVVTDIHMPNMNGLELSATIKRENPDAQIVVLTADLTDDSLIEALHAGVDRYITKPVDMRLLADAIGKCLRDRDHLNELRLNREIALLNTALQKEKAEHLALIHRLEEAHNQLLLSEKMASIGQLAAGVAHEINNPLGFVTANFSVLQQYITRLSRLLGTYTGLESALSAQDRSTLTQIKAEIDFEFLNEDLREILEESASGLLRVKQIVQSLTDFAEGGGTDFEPCDLHDCLETTLSVMTHELKGKTEILREYGELPLVDCIPSEIRQVFMNLLANAAQATTGEGRIVIRTRRQADYACIEITDNGHGIPPDILNRIFDPFFTTKPVGVGTGLGLSIAHGIIRKHAGRIEVDNRPGQGATFRLLIPLHRPEAAATTT